MNPIKELKQDATGAVILADWLGEGGHPVDHEISDRRSESCLMSDNSKPCPHNTAPEWWEKPKDAIALMIRKQLAIKHRMDLYGLYEGALHMCDLCGCCLKLKIHVPIEHIRNHTDLETLAKYPDYCWIKKELLT